MPRGLTLQQHLLGRQGVQGELELAKIRQVRTSVIAGAAGLVVDHPEAQALAAGQLGDIDAVDAAADAHLDAVLGDDQRLALDLAVLRGQPESRLEEHRPRVDAALQPRLDEFLPVGQVAFAEALEALALQFPQDAARQASS